MKNYKISDVRNEQTYIITGAYSSLGAGTIREIEFYRPVVLYSLFSASNSAAGNLVSIQFDNVKSDIQPFIKNGAFSMDLITGFYWHYGTQILFEKGKLISKIAITFTNATPSNFNLYFEIYV